MLYLQSHGYDVPSVLHIAAAVHTSSNMLGFTSRLSIQGMPVMEAQFLWYIIDGSKFDSMPVVSCKPMLVILDNRC